MNKVTYISHEKEGEQIFTKHFMIFRVLFYQLTR